MKIEYQNKPIDWDNAGIMPPQDLIEKGFQPGYKPPAEYFNAILHNTSEAIKEIQEKTVELSDSAGGGTVGSTIIDVTCTYTAPDTETGTIGEYTITTDVDLQSEDFFCLRFVAPNDYVKDTVFTIGSESYTAVNAGFKENDLVTLNFDVSQQKCFFVSGGGAGDGDTITTKVVCAGNGTDHKGGIYIGNSPISYGNADNKLDNSILLDFSATSGKYNIISGAANTDNSKKTLILGNGNTTAQNKEHIVVIGYSNEANQSQSIVCGQSNKLNSKNSFVIGTTNTVNGTAYSQGVICGGYNNVINNSSYSIVSGSDNITNGSASLVIGGNNTEIDSSSWDNIIAGYKNVVSGSYNAAFGRSNKNKVDGSYTTDVTFMAGLGNTAISEINSGAEYSAVFGVGNVAKGMNLVCGMFNKTPRPTSISSNFRGDLFVIGNGTGTYDGSDTVTPTTRTNAFRVAYDGNVYGTKAYTASGADYAEMFEWADGNPDNEDRRGLFVTLDGEKIRPASADDDYILGVVSATPSVVADAQTDDWGKKWKTDIFGERLLDENGAWILNENFHEEDNESYVSRLDRKEWAAVGLVGKLIIVDDGTCEVNGYCVPANGGIATKSETGYRVLSRVDENHIKVLIK